jgi:ABC-type transporter Mla MlaB component
MQEASPTSLTERCPPRCEALLAVSEVISLQRDLSALLQDLVRYLRVDVTNVTFIDTEGQALLATCGGQARNCMVLAVSPTRSLVAFSREG